MRASNLKPLVAILSLPVFSFTASQYLPYAIAAVPLAIFAISTVVALILTIYLVKLAISITGDKKKIDLNTVGRGVSVQTNNVSTQAEVTSGNGVSTQTTAITSTPPPALDQSTPTPPPPLEEQAARKSSNNGDKQQKEEDLMGDLKNILKNRRAGIAGKQGNDVQQARKLGRAFDKISDMIPPPPLRDRSNSVSSSDSRESGHGWSDNEDERQTPQNSQSGSKKRSESPDSDYGSDDNVKSESTSPSHSVPKAVEPPVPLKPANLQTRHQAFPVKEENNVGSVNSEMQDPSTLSVKERAKIFSQTG